MWYCNKEYSKIGEVFNLALKLAKEDKQEAMKFFRSYIDWIQDNNPDKSFEECEEIAKSNFGYVAGYYDEETCKIIYNTYQCSHPIFGDKPFDASPEEAFRKGQESVKGKY